MLFTGNFCDENLIPTLSLLRFIGHVDIPLGDCGRVNKILRHCIYFRLGLFEVMNLVDLSAHIRIILPKTLNWTYSL